LSSIPKAVGSVSRRVKMKKEKGLGAKGEGGRNQAQISLKNSLP
jgi:hypothetical protein